MRNLQCLENDLPADSQCQEFLPVRFPGFNQSTQMENFGGLNN